MSSRARLRPLFEPVTVLRSIAGQVVYFGCWLAITVIGVVLTPSVDGHGTHQQLGLPPCPCVLIFNRPCPGCGLTTSWSSLLHGRIGAAFKANWFGPLLYLMFTVTAIGSLVGFLRRERFTINHRPIQNFMMAFTVLFVAYGVGRFCVMNHYQTAAEAVLAGFK